MAATPEATSKQARKSVDELVEEISVNPFFIPSPSRATRQNSAQNIYYVDGYITTDEDEDTDKTDEFSLSRSSLRVTK
jgi:hypothetical protein